MPQTLFSLYVYVYVRPFFVFRMLLGDKGNWIPIVSKLSVIGTKINFKKGNTHKNYLNQSYIFRIAKYNDKTTIRFEISSIKLLKLSAIF